MILTGLTDDCGIPLLHFRLTVLFTSFSASSFFTDTSQNIDTVNFFFGWIEFFFGGFASFISFEFDDEEL